MLPEPTSLGSVKCNLQYWITTTILITVAADAKLFQFLLVKPNENPKTLEINFIDMPNAVQSNISLSSNVSLKMSDLDYHAVLIANKILGGGFNSYLNMNLREEHGYTYGARSSVGTDKYVSRFSAGAAVRNAVTDSAVVETVKEIKRIKAEPVTADALSNAKAKYVGDFVLALERPSTIAQYAISTKVTVSYTHLTLPTSDLV